MSRRIILGAAAAWSIGVLALALAGWRQSPAMWRVVTAGILAAAAMGSIALSVRRARDDAAFVALAATVGVAVAAPASMASIVALVVILGALSGVLIGFYVITLSNRVHAVEGPVLQHGAARIAGTVGGAAALCLAPILGVRLATSASSPRWAASLDRGSVHLLVAMGVLLFVAFVGLSLLLLARAYRDLDRDAGAAVGGPPDSEEAGDATQAGRGARS